MMAALTQTHTSAFRAGAASSARRSARSAVKVYATHRVDRFDKKDIIVSPSILSANFSKLGEQVWSRVAAITCHGVLFCSGSALDGQSL